MRTTLGIKTDDVSLTIVVLDGEDEKGDQAVGKIAYIHHRWYRSLPPFVEASPEVVGHIGIMEQVFLALAMEGVDVTKFQYCDALTSVLEHILREGER